jgi:hypothetical protein
MKIGLSCARLPVHAVSRSCSSSTAKDSFPLVLVSGVDEWPSATEGIANPALLYGYVEHIPKQRKLAVYRGD